jgi:hypothetical protein
MTELRIVGRLHVTYVVAVLHLTWPKGATTELRDNSNDNGVSTELVCEDKTMTEGCMRILFLIF